MALASRSIAVAQAPSGGDVEPSIRIDDDGIVAPRLLRGDESVEHVVHDALQIARARIADAAAARQLEADRVARRHGLPPLGPDRSSRAQRHRARRAGTAAGASTRGVAHTLEIAQERDRRSTGTAK